MLPELEIQIDQIKLQRLFSSLNGMAPPNFRGRLLSNAIRKAGLLAEARLKESVSGDILNVRSGHLRNSIQSRLDYEGNNVSAIVGSGTRSGKRLPYADIHETGGVIKPKLRKWLTIPLSAALTPAGVLRKPALMWENTFIAKGIIFQKRGKKGKIVPLFKLARQVVIPARHYMSRTLSACKNQIEKIIYGDIENQLRKAK